jgi:mannose-1-phosphate guanylyltransferase
MKAMILAAGLGTRLRPLTLVRPKVLVPVVGTPVLEFWLWHLRKAGARAAVVNVFHLSEKLACAVAGDSWPLPVESRVEQVLLGTGGGLRNVLDFLGAEPAIVINGDIICDAPLDELLGKHAELGAAASLLLHDCPRFNNVAVDENDLVLGFGPEALELKQNRPNLKLLAFTGIHCIDPAILSALPRDRFSDILTLYREMIRAGRPPRAIYRPGLFWREMGSIEAYWELTRELVAMREDFLPPLHCGGGGWIHPGASIDPGVELRGVVVAGDGCRVMKGALLEDVILRDRVRVAPGSRLRRCIATDGSAVQGAHDGEIITGPERE